MSLPPARPDSNVDAPDPELGRIAGELLCLEIELFHGSAAEFTRLDAIVPVIRELGDAAMLARALSLASRAQIVRGNHECAIGTAEAAVAIFRRLEARVALRCAGAHAEALRACGNVLLEQGHVARAFPKLEEAVAVAQAALESSVRTPTVCAISAQSALVRSLISLGAALFATREIDTAIDVYYRTIAVADAHPEAYARFPDDVMLALWNLTETLHERVRSRRANGDDAGADADLAAAQAVLDSAAARIEDTSFERAGYFGALGRQLLLTNRPAEAFAMFARQLDEVERHASIDKGNFAFAKIGMAQAALALGHPAEALDHSEHGLRALDEHDEATDRAAALLVRSAAYRELSRHAEAFDALAGHYAVRSQLEAVAANQYASRMTTRLGLERAQAAAESHRHVAAMLETLGRVGQEITANLDPDAVCRILQGHVCALLDVPGFAIWLIDDTGTSLSLRYGTQDGRIVWAPDIPLDDPASTAACAVRAKTEIFSDATSVARGCSGPAEPHHMRSTLVAPLLVGERALGVISIQSDRCGDYTENERSLVRSLCIYGAIALDHAAAYMTLARTVETLQATQAELAARTAEYERLSMTDPLTGLANRRHLLDRAAAEIAERRRKGSELAVAMFDIDHFKRVNDTYGHAVGDIVLQSVARLAKDWLRPADFIARVGGEEFALLLPGAGVREAVAIADRIRASIAETPMIAGGAQVCVTSSFGVANFDASIDTLDRALSRADAALYAAKQAGRNRVHYGE